MSRAHEAARCFIRAAESLLAHPVSVGRAAVWASVGMAHLSHVPGAAERGEEIVRRAPEPSHD
jgi:hypothetical protein